MAKAENQIKGRYKNILDEYFRSSVEEKTLGKLFYPNANSIARDIGYYLNINGDEGLDIGAGIIAALSPQTEWMRNVILAFEFVEKKWADKQTKANKQTNPTP